MNHHTAPALEDLASEFGIIVDDMFIPAGDYGMCRCEQDLAGARLLDPRVDEEYSRYGIRW